MILLVEGSARPLIGPIFEKKSRFNSCFGMTTREFFLCHDDHHNDGANENNKEIDAQIQ